MRLIFLLGACAACNVVEPPSEAPECDVEPVEIRLPENCYEDLETCPQEVDGEPWQGVCTRRYMCEVEQPDGTYPYVCTTAFDCPCMEEYAECDPRAEPPPFCALQEK